MNYLERVNKRLRPCEIFLGGPNCNPPGFIVIAILIYFVYVNIDESIVYLRQTLHSTPTAKSLETNFKKKKNEKPRGAPEWMHRVGRLHASHE